MADTGSSGAGEEAGTDASTPDDAGSSGGGGDAVAPGTGMYDFVFVAHPFGAEHIGYNFYATVFDVTSGMPGTRVGEVQGSLDPPANWENFTWPKILQVGHKYIMAMFADKAMTCTPANIHTAGGQWVFPIPAPGDVAIGSGFPMPGTAPVTQGQGGGMSTGVITDAIVTASEKGAVNPDGTYYLYRFSSAPAPQRIASCMYFPNSMASVQLLPACGGTARMCHP
jgi:hypothetical protein